MGNENDDANKNGAGASNNNSNSNGSGDQNNNGQNNQNQGKDNSQNNNNKNNDNENNDSPEFNDPFKPGQKKDDEDNGNNSNKKDDDDAETDPDDVEIINKHVEKKIQPVLTKLETQERNGEVDSFMSSEIGKEFKPYEAKIREYSLSKQGKNLTVKAIAYAVAGPDLLKIGARIGKKKDQESNNNDTSGSGSRPSDNSTEFPDVSNMPKQEFTNLVEQVKQGKFSKK